MAFLEINNIHKSFKSLNVLNGVSFSLNKGEVLAIIGSSGGGKTTLLRCINFLESPEQGTITINGEKIFDAYDKDIDPEIIRKNRLKLGLVFQQFNLFPQYTAIENLKLAPKMLNNYNSEKELEEKAIQILKKVGLEDKAESYPCQLSGGQQQRVAIARALMMEPDILCFDEPTSALGPELTGEVLKVIKSLKSKDSTMIIVTHEMQFAKDIADKVIFLDQGQIAIEGTSKEVFGSKSERIKSFLGKYSEQ